MKGRPRIYPETRAASFNVRVHPRATSTAKRLAAQLGVSETEARRILVNTAALLFESYAAHEARKTVA